MNRRRIAFLVATIMIVGPAVAQSMDGPGADHEQRNEFTEGTASELEGATRILRFAQVTDMQLVDDDAPYPMRQGVADAFYGATISGGAYRPHEEYGDEIMAAMSKVLAAQHDEDALDFIIHTGDNIDNALENELMRYMDLIRGTHTTVGPFSGYTCKPDGQSINSNDTVDINSPFGDTPHESDVLDACTSLPAHLVGNFTDLDHIPWYSLVGNHDVLIQGNVPVQPGFQQLAGQFGRHFLTEGEYLAMHFDDLVLCDEGEPAGSADDDWGHGYGLAGERLCDDDPENDGYYAYDLRGVRFIVLDTVNDEVYQTHRDAGGTAPSEATGHDHGAGASEGALDATQFLWLQDELAVANESGQLAVIVGHHTVNAFYDAQFDSACGPPGCATDALREVGFVGREDLMEMLAGFPNAVAFMGGHTHQHRVQAKLFDNATSPGFWNIETSGLLDLPQESRIVELWLTNDGRGAWILTPLGHAFQQAISLAESDPQHDAEEAAGTALDRDVVLWFDIPSGVGLSAGPQPGGPPAPAIGQMSAQVIVTAGDGREATIASGRHVVPAGDINITVTLHDAASEVALTGMTVTSAETSFAGDGNGSYIASLTVEPGEVDLALVAADPSGGYHDLAISISLKVAHPDDGVFGSGEGPTGANRPPADDDEDTPGVPLMALATALAAAAVVMRRRL